MIQLRSPTLVRPSGVFSVPRWIVTYSRIVLPSPISTRVASSTFAVLS